MFDSFRQRPRNRTALSRLKSTWLFAWIVAIGLALGHLKDVTDGLDRLLVLTKFKPDALSLARDREKVEFSRGLTETAWRRIFWARAFRARLAKGASSIEVDAAWKEYIKASEAWSTRIMVYIVATDRYYGPQKSEMLEKVVQDRFNQMGEALIALRYGPSTDKALSDANSTIDAANGDLYTFVRGFAEKKR